MALKTLFRAHLYLEDFLAAIEALRNKGDEESLRIAAEWRVDYDFEMKSRETAREASELLAAERRERASNASLTVRQANCLAALRAGAVWSSTWEPYSAPLTRGDGSKATGMWRHTRSMGGAIHRMWSYLEEEGLVTERGRQLTPEGLARLERWETEHPKTKFPKKGEL
jgi:hypothetical protein